MRSVAIVLARQGSRRVPGKNVRLFAGRPVLHYPVAAALESGCFQDVMVSTDSPEIARLARQAGASVPFLRSAATASDHATTAEALIEVIEEYGRRGQVFDLLCGLYATAALVRPDRLRAGQSLLARCPDLDSVVPVVRFEHPIERAFDIQAERLVPLAQAHLSTRSQDLRPRYHDAGQWYWMRVPALLSNRAVFSPRTAPVVLDRMEAQDIDDESDWLLAEIKHRGTLHP